MKIKDTRIVKLELDPNEYEALHTVHIMLDRLGGYFGPNADLMSIMTGEVVNTKEFARLRGILSAFYDNADGEYWEC